MADRPSSLGAFHAFAANTRLSTFFIVRFGNETADRWGRTPLDSIVTDKEGKKVVNSSVACSGLSHVFDSSVFFKEVSCQTSSRCLDGDTLLLARY